jgi:iron complex outermembrane receptor protein
MSIHVSRRALAALLALPFAVPAHAEEAALDDAGTILVVGQHDAPISIEPRGLSVSLGEAQFQGVNAFNVEDLMKYAPNFFVRKRFTGDSNGVPGFRGTHSTQSARALVMVDGFVVSNFLGNSFNFAPKWGVVGPGEVRQFDIVYGPYSSRYAGNSMGGIVNITTRDPVDTEAFVTVQGFVQPYRQYSTDADYAGYSAEAGFGFKQKDGPFSVRVTGRLLENRGQPMSWYGLTPATGTAPRTTVTGAVIDTRQQITGSPGIAVYKADGTLDAANSRPIFAAQSPADITQAQGKLKLGYDDGVVTAQALFIYWRNLDRQYHPEIYLRDAAGNPFPEGRVTTLGAKWTAQGANFSRTSRDEYLAGLKIAAPMGPMTAKLNLSTYQVASMRTLTSNGYVAGATRGAGTLADQGPTGWYAADLTIEHKSDTNELAGGLSTNLYRTDLTRFKTSNWRSAANPVFDTQTFGKTRQLSAWIEDRVPLPGEASITAGIRVDSWRAFDGGLSKSLAGVRLHRSYDARQDTAVRPTLSAQTAIGPQTTAQLSLAMATRFPTVGELFQGSFRSDGSFDENSFDPNLKPERSHDANLLIAHDFGSVTLTGSIFWQRAKDAIFSFQRFIDVEGVPASVTNFTNIDRTRQYGFELIAETRDWPIPGMAIDANAAINDSKTVKNRLLADSEGIQFPRIPRWRINADVRYAFTDAIDGSIGLRYASRPNTDLLGAQRGDTFGYTSELFALDVRMNWKLPSGFRVSAGVDNITNDRAWVFHPYPQRTFLIEAGWRL